jgi:hypothetical protein
MDNRKQQVIEAIKTLTEVIKECREDRKMLESLRGKIKELIVEL